MSDSELKTSLKQLVFDNSRDEHESPEDGLKIGLLNNQQLFNEVQSLMEYFKTVNDE